MKHNTIWLTKSAIDVSIHRKTDEYNYCLRAVSLINWTTPSSSLLDLGMIDSNTIASPNLPFRKTSCFIWWFHPAARLAFQLSRSNNQPQFWSTRLTNFHNTQRHPSKPFRPRCPQKKKQPDLCLEKERQKYTSWEEIFSVSLSSCTVGLSKKRLGEAWVYRRLNEAPFRDKTNVCLSSVTSQKTPILLYL